MSPKQPTKKDIKIALKELKGKGFVIKKEIGEGSYGKVYKAFYEKKPLVIKIVKARRASRQRSKLIHKQFKKTLKKIGKEYSQYFTEDRYEESEDGTMLYQYMEFLEGTDLLDFFENNGNTITFDNLLKIFCGLLHALYFFHSAGVLFNDLKLENVFINPKTFDVTMIDYTDSSLGCNQKECKITKDTVQTYLNRDNLDTTKEDVWRLCLLWMDCITIIINLKEQRIFDDLDYFSEEVTDMLGDEKYPSAEINTELKDYFLSFEKLFPRYLKTITELKLICIRMLHENPEKRPSISSLLKTKLFSSVCSKEVIQNKKRDMQKKIIKIKFKIQDEFKNIHKKTNTRKKKVK